MEETGPAIALFHERLSVCLTPSHNMPPGAVEPTSVKSVSVQIRDTDSETGVRGSCHNISSSTTTVTNEYDFFQKFERNDINFRLQFQSIWKAHGDMLVLHECAWAFLSYPIASRSH